VRPLHSRSERQFEDPHAIDKQIAAIAWVHNLVLVTRGKGSAFARIANLSVFNPFIDQTSYAQF
jgi:predicted nucleic acid-binding protein